MGLEAATRLKTTGTGLALTLDPAWEIWGPAGGYLAAIALRAVGEQAEARHRPITLTGQFVGVAKPGQLEVAVEVLKPGGAALYAVRLSQDGRLIFLAQIWTTARCEPSHPIAPKMPPVPPPSSCVDTHAFFAQRGAAEIPFWRNIDGRLVNPRWADEPPPADPRQLRWMRYCDWEPTAHPYLEAMRSALLIDIGVWPAHWHRLTEPADYLAPSLDLTVWFHQREPAGEWLLSEADSDVAAVGVVNGRVRIWAEDGRVIATGGGQCLVLPARR
jgi:acyl-CoA thioesterase